MKIGYACINSSLTCRSSKTFRLASFTPERFHETVTNNLHCLLEILQWNLENKIYYFRISSDLIPFASHPVCTIAWEKEYKKQFQEIGMFIKKNAMRVTMHPDQFVLLQALRVEVVQNSLAELLYHAKVLELMELDESHKIQIHVGGAYGDKETSSNRFVARNNLLPEQIQKRLIIENDERLYNLSDCLKIHKATNIPIIFDTLHHEINNNGESVQEAFRLFTKTWEKKDGLPMVDYSAQDPDKRTGAHIFSIKDEDFREFLAQTKQFDFDIMLEIKDKEQSALRALTIQTSV